MNHFSFFDLPVFSLSLVCYLSFSFSSFSFAFPFLSFSFSLSFSFPFSFLPSSAYSTFFLPFCFSGLDSSSGSFLLDFFLFSSSSLTPYFFLHFSKSFSYFSFSSSTSFFNLFLSSSDNSFHYFLTRSFRSSLSLCSRSFQALNLMQVFKGFFGFASSASLESTIQYSKLIITHCKIVKIYNRENLLIIYKLSNSQLKQMLQPQQPQQTSFCFQSSPSSDYLYLNNQSERSQGGEDLCSPQQLQQNKEKLYRLTLFREEHEQIANYSLNQIISYQGIVECVKDLADHYAEILRKKISLSNLQSIKAEKQRALMLLRKNSEDTKARIKLFRDKMQIHVLGNQSIKKMLAYSTTHNIQKVVEECIRHQIKEIIHNTHPCAHNNSSSSHSKKSYRFKEKCTQNCRLGELLEFIAAFKSTRLCSKIQEMWGTMEKEVFREVSGFVRMYGGNLISDEGITENEKIIEKKLMDIKVDQQIIKNQSNSLLQQIGIENEESFSHHQHFIQEVFKQLKEKKHYLQSSHYDDGNDISKLSRTFYQYVAHIAGSYQEQYRQEMKQQLEQRITQAALNQIDLAIKKAIQSSEKRLSIQQKIERIQKNIHSIQLQIQQAQIKKQQIEEQLGWSKQTQETGNLTSKLRVNRRYHIEGMRFKVIKIMHISTVGLARNIGAASYTYSRGSSRVSAASQAHTKRSHNSSRATIATDRASNNQYSQRILQFGKHKLILRKQNPHFHEQIEVKRIAVVKIRSRTLIHIYFRKGYMSLEFIQCENNSVENVARSWVEMFQIIYYDYVGQIQYQFEQEAEVQDQNDQNDKQNALAKSNLIVQQENYNVQGIIQHGVTNFITFQNSKKVSSNSII